MGFIGQINKLNPISYAKMLAWLMELTRQPMCK